MVENVTKVLVCRGDAQPRTRPQPTVKRQGAAFVDKRRRLASLVPDERSITSASVLPLPRFGKRACSRQASSKTAVPVQRRSSKAIESLALSMRERSSIHVLSRSSIVSWTGSAKGWRRPVMLACHGMAVTWPAARKACRMRARTLAKSKEKTRSLKDSPGREPIVVTTSSGSPKNLNHVSCSVSARALVAHSLAPAPCRRAGCWRWACIS